MQEDISLPTNKIMSNTDINICLTIDKNYIQYVYATINSIITNNKSNIVFHLIYADIKQKQISKLVKWIEENNVKVFTYHISLSDFSICPNNKDSRLSRTAYVRINIAYILPLYISKVLYLDSDIIVNSDLQELYSICIDSYAIACVEVIENYFNSGVMLMNLSYFREHSIPKKVFEFIKLNPDKLECFDQDALNDVLKGKYLKIPPKYNAGDILLQTLEKQIRKSNLYIYSEEEIQEAYDKPVIIHYAGSFHYKPWYKYTFHSKQDLFLFYLKATPYKNIKLKSNYILYLMQNIEDRYFHLKEYVKQYLIKIFKNKKGIYYYIIMILYNNNKTRKHIFSFITRLFYIQKRFFHKHFDFVISEASKK